VCTAQFLGYVLTVPLLKKRYDFDVCVSLGAGGKIRRTWRNFNFTASNVENNGDRSEIRVARSTTIIFDFINARATNKNHNQFGI